MSVPVYSRAEVEALLDPLELIEALEKAFADVSAGRCSMPPRIAAHSPPGLLGAMVAYVPSLDTLAAKLVSLFPHNSVLPTHQALIAVFDPRDGSLRALMDGTAITAQRTAAASALAARLFARKDARVLSIIGTGVQAEAHARYLPLVREFREVLIAGRDIGKARALAAKVPRARAVELEEAARSADVICLTTHAAQPVIRGEWVREGTHVSSVGFNAAGSELDGALIHRAQLVVEARAAAFAPPPAGAPELRGHDPRGAIELGEPASSTRPTTLYKSVGIAAEDAAAASVVLRKRGAQQMITIDR